MSFKISRTTWGMMRAEGGKYRNFNEWFKRVKSTGNSIIEVPLISVCLIDSPLIF